MNIKPEFMKPFNVRTSIVDNIWDPTKLKHKKDDPANLMLVVSKLINNIGSTAPAFTIPVQAQCTKAEVTNW